MANNLKILISGGGTGGHIFPALSLAEELKKRYPNCEILFVGAKGKMEMEKIPNAGYDIVGLPIRGIQRKLSLKNLTFPFLLLYSMFKAFLVIKRFKPNFVIGTGGYASGPTLKMASLLKIPSFIQEQNSFPGITNRWLSKTVRNIFVAYGEMNKFFPDNKIIYSGNPLRDIFSNGAYSKAEAREKLGLPDDKKVVLVLGGSQGAMSINNSLNHKINDFIKSDVCVLWQTGKLFYDQNKNLSEELKHKNIFLTPFIKDMHLAYSAADLVVSRAGALTISEMSLCGVPAIFIPLPSAAENHQMKNALKLADSNAAIIVEDNKALEKLVNEALILLDDDKRLNTFRNNIKEFAVPNSASKIIDKILSVLNIQSD
ncbi:MAG: undecaprenyldiphospho-muramoylpentapeptide beta-N-acetylglucosaminyltransferase [Hyphomicrobiales bacterium]